MIEAYSQLKSELRIELDHILKYWENNTIDVNYGGFYGRIDHHNIVIEKASKGIILNTRILWSFAAASNHLGDQKYADLCLRSFQYLKDYFYDSQNGGFYWEVDFMGKPVNRRKQIYAQAFAIYALSEYYLLCKNDEVKSMAISTYKLIEENAKDEVGGYIEAFDEKWGDLIDLRLSSKDMNAAKTMNTHLHILEAYTTLLKIYDDNELRSSLKTLIDLLQEKFLNERNHYELFFDQEWNLLSNIASYGHDIEAAWLVIEAAKIVGDKALLKRCESSALQVIDTFLEEAIDLDGAVMNEINFNSNKVDSDRHWWPQVEALIGLYYAYGLTGNQKFIKSSIKIWEFIKFYLKDIKHGEWYFRVDENGVIYQEEDKVSMWKAPYHVSRCLILLNE